MELSVKRLLSGPQWRYLSAEAADLEGEAVIPQPMDEQGRGNLGQILKKLIVAVHID